MKNVPVILTIAGISGFVVLGIAALISGIESSGGELAAVSLSDAVAGATEAPVTVIEYSDFQCPACKAYAPLVKELIASSNGEVRVVYRHFPLPQHINAVPTAIASEAAARQGKFWEMAEIIFMQQDEWKNAENPNELLKQYAAQLKLDVAAFEADLADPAIREKVLNDLATGQKAGVNATPTFFVNGKKIQNPRSLEEFKEIINAAGR